MKLAPGADEKTPMAEVMGKEILDAWFNNACKPNPEDDEALRQVEELESIYRTSQGANPVESRTR
jgi:hypothetical protein